MANRITPPEAASETGRFELARLRSDGYDWRPRLGGVSASALVIHVEKDVLPLAVAVEISQVLPFARLHIVPTAGHMPFWEAPGTFFSLTETFLTSLDAGRSVLSGMRRVALPVLSLALVFCLSNAYDPNNGAAAMRMRYRDSAAGTLVKRRRHESLPSTSFHLSDGSLADARRRVRIEAAGTYIGDILQERDSALAHWPDRKGVPLTVWVQPTSGVRDFSVSFVDRVRDAFAEWDGLHLPIHFTFVDDSADAEVHVNWIDRFHDPISGRTRWARDDAWAITDANITLAVHHSQGELLDDDAMEAMALHEIGHLLGLDHTADTTSIMAPRVRVRSLSAADRATIRLLYALPAGPIR